MKRIVRFQCELCGEIFDSESECHAHGIAELGTTEELYKEYREIRTRVASASSSLGFTNNDKTRSEFDSACEAEVEFELRTGIPIENWRKI